MSQNPDIIGQLEHDHLVVERMVDDLREGIQSALRGECDPLDLFDSFVEFLSAADEELFEHFDREEQVVFPFLLENVPESAESIRRLEYAHDRMCGAMGRMQRIVDAGGDQNFLENFEAMIALFTRFDANFGRHSREEIALFHTLGQQLTNSQLATLQHMLAEI